MIEHAIRSALRRVAAFAWDRPATTGAWLLALVALAIWGAFALRVDFSSTAFYGDDDEAVAALASFHERWGPDDDVLMVVASAREGDVLSRERIETIGRLADALGVLPDVQSVTSIATQRVPLPGSTLDEAVPLWDLPALDRIGPLTRDELLARLPYVPLLLSTDARHAAIVVRLGFSSDDPGRAGPVVDGLSSVVREFDGEDGLSLGLAGVPVVRASFVRLTIRDQMVLVPAALLLMGAALAWIFRRLHGVLIPAAAAVLPVTLLAGLMGWTGEPVGLLNQAYVTLIPVLALADAVHFLARYHEERREGPARTAILDAVEHVGFACTLTTATTVVAFASLALGGTPVLARFGLFAACGMLLAYATVVPTLALLLRVTGAGGAPAVRGRWLSRLAVLATTRPVVIVLLSVAVAAVFVATGMRVVVDNRLSNLLEPDHPARQAGALIDRWLGGTLSLEVELEGPPDAFLQPWTVSATAAFEDWAAGQPGVRAVIGPGRNLEAVAQSTAAVLASPDAIRAVFERLATLVDPATMVSDDYARARISIRVAEPGGLEFQRFADAVLAEAQATFEPFGVRATVTGTTLLAYRGVNRIGRALAISLLSILGVIAIMFLALFRSMPLMLVAVATNALPLVVGYGALGALGVHLDPLSGVILAFGLGISVDNTIHVIARVGERERAGDLPRDAIRNAVRHSGRAVAITSLVISGGLGINVLSSFPPLALLGVLGALVMLTALLSALLLLPALLVLLGDRRPLGP